MSETRKSRLRTRIAAKGLDDEAVDDLTREMYEWFEDERERYETDDDFREWVETFRPELAHTLEWDEHPDGHNDECFCYECRTQAD